MEAQINKKKYAYCEVIASLKVGLFSSATKIEVDFGQGLGKSFWDDFTGKNPHEIKDEATGKVKLLKSVVDALNYMSSLGWELHTALAITHQNQNVYHYILRKEI